MSQHFIGMDLCKMWLTAALFWSKFILTLMWIVLAQVPYAQSKKTNKPEATVKNKKQGYSKLHQTPGNDLVDTWGHMDNPFNADTMRWGEFIQMLELQDFKRKWVNKEAVTHENSSFFFLLGIAGQSHINGMNLMLLFFMLPLVSLTFSFFISSWLVVLFIYFIFVWLHCSNIVDIIQDSLNKSTRNHKCCHIYYTSGGALRCST